MNLVHVEAGLNIRSVAWENVNFFGTTTLLGQDLKGK